jgi:hypothetical protein
MSSSHHLLWTLQNEVWCKGACGGNLSQHLIALENAECSSWEAFRARKARYDPVCARGHSTGSDAGLRPYCGAVFSEDRFRQQLRTLAAHADGTVPGTVAEDEAALASICTPCFHEFIRLTYRYGTSAADPSQISRLAEYESLCVRDGARFCFPRFHNQTRETTAGGRVAYTRALCDPAFMGRCAARMQVRVALANTSSSTVAAAAVVEAETMCAANSGGALCADAMSAVIGGFDATANTAFNTSRQRTYAGPADGKCSQVLSERHTCTFGCQTSFAGNRNFAGCCYATTQASLTSLGYTGVAEAFGTAAMLGQSCNRPADSECVLVDLTNGVTATLVVAVPIRVLVSPSVEFTSALSADLQRAVGTTAGGVRVQSIRKRTRTSSLVQFMVYGASRTAAIAMVAQLDADVAANRVAFLETTRVYNAECHRRDGSGCGVQHNLLGMP